MWNRDEGVSVEELCEVALVSRFGFVVEFFDQSRLQLVDDWPGLHAGEHGREASEQPSSVVEIGAHGVGNAGILNFHGNGALITRDGAMNLPDRGGRDRHWVPLEEQRIGRFPEFTLDLLRGQLRAHRWSVVLQRRQSLAHVIRQTGVDVAGHLANLHHCALHVAELGRDVGCRLHLKLGVEGFLSLRRSKG